MFPFFQFGRQRHMRFGCFGGVLRLILLIFGIKYLVDHTGSQKPVYTPSRPINDQPQNPAPGDVTKHSSGSEPAPDPWVNPVN
ncbi:MAG: hypothetical protein ACYCZF_07860 [Anaerolineae bacterium]